MTADAEPGSSTADESTSSFDLGLDLQASALANDQLVVASIDITIREAARLMSDESIGLLVLKDGDAVAGVVSERDVLRSVADAVDPDSPASSIGNTDAIKYSVSSSTVGEVAMEMMENYVRHVLIAGPDGQPESIVSMRDLLAVIVE